MTNQNKRIAALSQLSPEEMDRVQGGGDDMPTEEVSFNFAQANIRYQSAAASDAEYKYVSVRRYY